MALAGTQTIELDDLQLAPSGLGADGTSTREVLSSEAGTLQEYLDRLERQAILEALERTRFNRTAAAKRLGITFRALRYRMARLGIQ